MPHYQPKVGVPFRQEDADVICPELVRLAKEHGGELTKQELKEAARAKRSPLHRYVFSDDVEAAAEKWYNHKAGALLRSFEVVWMQDRKEHCANLMEYVIVNPEEDSEEDEEEDLEEMEVRPRSRSGRKAYVPVTEVMTNENYQQQLLRRAEETLEQWRHRFAKLENLVDFRTRFGRTYRNICNLFPEE